MYDVYSYCIFTTVNCWIACSWWKLESFPLVYSITRKNMFMLSIEKENNLLYLLVPGSWARERINSWDQEFWSSFFWFWQLSCWKEGISRAHLKFMNRSWNVTMHSEAAGGILWNLVYISEEFTWQHNSSRQCTERIDSYSSGCL